MHQLLYYLKDYFDSPEGILLTISLCLLGVATAKAPLHPFVGKERLLALRESGLYFTAAMFVFLLALASIALKPGLQMSQRIVPAALCFVPLAVIILISKMQDWNSEKLSNLA